MENWLNSEFDPILPTSDGADLRINCPFCKIPDTGYHLYVSTVKPVAHCFRCGWRGSHVALVKEVSGADSYADAYRLIEQPGKVAGFDSISDQLNQRRQARQLRSLKMPEWFILFNGNMSWHGKKVFEYAARRLSRQELIQYNIGYCKDPKVDDLQFRMVIPVESGYWQARDITEKAHQKYLNPKIPLSGRLFNYAALSGYKKVFLAEGVISAIALGPSAVAVLGHKATREQAVRIVKSPAETVVIAFDADTEFSDGVTDLADFLTSSGKEVIIRTYQDGDPDSCNVWSEETYSLKHRIYAILQSRSVF